MKPDDVVVRLGRTRKEVLQDPLISFEDYGDNDLVIMIWRKGRNGWCMEEVRTRCAKVRREPLKILQDEIDEKIQEVMKDE